MTKFSAYCGLSKNRNLCLYLVLLVFLEVFNQTSVTKVEIYLCFYFLSANMYFEKVVMVAIATTELMPDKF